VHDLGFGLYRGRDFGGYAAVAPDPSDRAGIWTVAQEQLTDGSLDEPNWSAIAHEVAPSTAPARRHATPAFGTRTDGSASLMYRRADGRIEWLRWYDPCPNCWTRADVFTPLGGLTTSPALDPDLSPGEEDLFVRRADGHIWYHPAFSAWVDLGGRATSAPAVLAQPTSGDCQRAVLIRAVDGTVRQRTQHRFDSEWGPWRSLGGSVAAGSQPAAVYFGDDREAVFVRGPDDHVHWRRSGDCGATWGRWSDLGGNAHTNPAASSERQRQLDVFVAAADGVMYTRHFARGNWSRWTALGGKLSSGPAAAVPQVPLVFPNTRPWGTEVIAVGKHQRLWDDLRPANSTWTGWRPLYSAEVQGLFD
jgi:hypothetical protein